MIAILLSGLLILSPLQDPDDPPVTLGELFSVPSGPLPWSIPILPQITLIPTLPVLSFNDIQNSSGYVEPEYSAPEDDLDQPLDSLTDTTGDFATVLPDVTQPGDFTTGLSPDGVTLSLYDFAAQFGTDVGQIFSRARSVSQIVQDYSLGGLALAISAIIISAVWTILLSMLGLLIRVADALWRVAVDVISTIGNYIPLT